MYKIRIRNNREKNKKAILIHRSLQLQADVDRLYIPRNCGGREMISVEDRVEMEKEPEEVFKKQHW